LDPSGPAGQATATSPCLLPSQIDITYTDRTEPNTSCPLIITRTWTATDPCGGSSVDTQTIQIDDTEEPEWFYFPPDIAIPCENGDYLPSASNGYPIASDKCQFPVCDITYADVLDQRPSPVGTCPGDLVIFRTWTATDDCGNSLSDVQELTVEFADPTVPCQPDLCPQEPCELCECDLDEPCNCCDAGGLTACLSVPCNPVACTAVPCTAVDCIACPIDEDNALAPLPICGNDTPCIPNIVPIFVDDDDYLVNDPETTDGNAIDDLASRVSYWIGRANYWRDASESQSSAIGAAPVITLVVLLVMMPITLFWF
jgi:hypothetical protein